MMTEGMRGLDEQKLQGDRLSPNTDSIQWSRAHFYLTGPSYQEMVHITFGTHRPIGIVQECTVCIQPSLAEAFSSSFSSFSCFLEKSSFGTIFPHWQAYHHVPALSVTLVLPQPFPIIPAETMSESTKEVVMSYSLKGNTKAKSYHAWGGGGRL